ncbi:MAG TPA: radical SAM protein [Polyangia bacterium]
MTLPLLTRLRYSPFVANVIVTRRCNLACGYCDEYDSVSAPVAVDVLEERLARLRALGTFGISLSGGEPTLHPELVRIVRSCRALGFVRTGIISNGMTLTPSLIRALGDAGLQELQLSLDGVHANSTTEKVLDRLHKRLGWLREHARFRVTVSGVVGACPADEVQQIIDTVESMGFVPRLGIAHDATGQIAASTADLRAYRSAVSRLPRTWMDFVDHRRALLRDGRAPFKCRGGSRYLYVDEDGLVSWCSQTRAAWSKPLGEYTVDDLRAQFHSYKPCQDACTLGCVRSASQLDGWRTQERPS